MKTISKTTVLMLAVLAVAWSVPAQALPLRGGRFIVVQRGYAYPGYFYDPFWGPYYPYGVYAAAGRPRADVKVEVVPKQTEVFVDGYYAGTAGEFDGIFKHLHTTPGGHAITLYLDGYRTITEGVYVRPDSTFKMKDTMDKLAAGEVSAPPPLPARRLR